MLSENASPAGDDQPQPSDPTEIIMGSDVAALTEIALAMGTRVRDLNLSRAMHLLTVDGRISEIRASLLATMQTANSLFGLRYMDNCIRSAAANPVYNGQATQLLAKGAIPYRIVKHQRETAVVIDNRPK